MGLRDDLSAAWDQAEAAEPEALAVQPETPEIAGNTPEPISGSPETPPVDTAGRDDRGRFAKSPETVQNPPVIPAVEPAAPTIRPPNTWTAAAKADFATLPPHIQQEVLKREKEIEDGKAQWDAKAGEYNRFNEVLAPYKERWAVQGTEPTVAIRQLLAASDWLERDPASALQYLARQYGTSLPQAPQPAQQAFQQPQLPPEIVNRLSSLETQLANQSRAEEASRTAAVQAEITAFEKDNIYFSNVKGEMVALLESGRASTLKDAYEMACWANPEVRGVLQAAQAKAAQDAAKAQKAMKASGSVTGSPITGQVNGATPKTTRDALLSAWDEVEGRA